MCIRDRFTGVINIMDDTWRIHSFNLEVTKTAQLEILDTLRISQLYVPVTKEVWQMKIQLLYFNFKQLGIDAVSYTHLDVYKRQLQYHAVSCGQGRSNFPSGHQQRKVPWNNLPHHPKWFVYNQRQCVGIQLRSRAFFGPNHACKIAEAVSYTHLDVYKRQA